MKKILSMLAIALVMAFSFTSCGMFGSEQPEPAQDTTEMTIGPAIEENDTILGTSASWFDSTISVQDSVTDTVVE